MKDRDKVILRQLQLSGLGLVILLFAWAEKQKALIWVGLAIWIFGLIRFMILRKLIGREEE